MQMFPGGSHTNLQLPNVIGYVPLRVAHFLRRIVLHEINETIFRPR